MASRSVSRERYSFANLSEPLELPDLIAIQRVSFEWFLKDGPSCCCIARLRTIPF